MRPLLQSAHRVNRARAGEVAVNGRAPVRDRAERLALPWFLIVPLLAAALMSLSAAGQETYRLGDDDAWTLTEAPDPATPEGQLWLAQRALVDGRADRAYDLADLWIEQYEGHPMLPTAYLIRGDAMQRRGDEYKALFDYELTARRYPGSEAYVIALRRELDIAKRYAAGMKRKMWGIRFVDASSIAEELLIRIQERLPGSNLAEEAGIELGDFYFRRGDMHMAAIAYELFIQNYPNSPRIVKSRERLIAAKLATFKGPQWDATGLYDARVQLNVMKAIAPMDAQRLGADAIITGIEEKLAEKRLINAKYYLRTGDPIAAEYTIRRLVRQYEKTRAAADALRMIPDLLPQLAQNLQDEVAPFYAERMERLIGAPPDESDEEDEG